MISNDNAIKALLYLNIEVQNKINNSIDELMRGKDDVNTITDRLFDSLNYSVEETQGKIKRSYHN